MYNSEIEISIQLFSVSRRTVYTSGDRIHTYNLAIINCSLNYCSIDELSHCFRWMKMLRYVIWKFHHLSHLQRKTSGRLCILKNRESWWLGLSSPSLSSEAAELLMKSDCCEALLQGRIAVNTSKPKSGMPLLPSAQAGTHPDFVLCSEEHDTKECLKNSFFHS